MQQLAIRQVLHPDRQLLVRDILHSTLKTDEKKKESHLVCFYGGYNIVAIPRR